MLAPALFAMELKEAEEEYNQQLNERMHAHVGYHEDDCNQCLMSQFQTALDKIP